MLKLRCLVSNDEYLMENDFFEKASSLNEFEDVSDQEADDGNQDQLGELRLPLSKQMNLNLPNCPLNHLETEVEITTFKEKFAAYVENVRKMCDALTSDVKARGVFVMYRVTVASSLMHRI